MTVYRWPTDPAGKAAAHTIPYATHQQHAAALKPPAPKPAKAAAPAAAPAPTSAPATPPPDAAYLSQVAGLQQDLTDKLAGLQTGRANQLAGYGYAEDPISGALTFNPNDAFSKAALLKKTYDASRARTGGAMAAGGQLYTGGYQQAQDIGAQQQLGAETQLHNSLTGWLAGNTSAQAAAPINEQMAEGTAYGNMLARQSANYNPPAASSTPTKVMTATGKPLAKGRAIAANPSGKGAAKGTVAIKGKKTPKGRVVTYTNTVKGP
jgi:hypothetical protein